MIDKLINNLEKQGKLKKQKGTLLSKGESKKAFSDAISLVQEILKEVKSKNPQLELKFEI